ncbi:MAG: S8 family serine peptidase [Bacillota bacterium]
MAEERVSKIKWDEKIWGVFGALQDGFGEVLKKSINSGELDARLAKIGITAHCKVLGSAGDFISISSAIYSGDPDKIGDAIFSFVGSQITSPVAAAWFAAYASKNGIDPIIGGMVGGYVGSEAGAQFGSLTWQTLWNGIQSVEVTSEGGTNIFTRKQFQEVHMPGYKENYTIDMFKRDFGAVNSNNNNIFIENKNPSAPISPIDTNQYYVKYTVPANTPWSTIEAQWGAANVQGSERYDGTKYYTGSGYQVAEAGTTILIPCSRDYAKQQVNASGGINIAARIGAGGDFSWVASLSNNIEITGKFYADKTGIDPNNVQTGTVIDVVNNKDANIGCYDPKLGVTNQFEFHVDPLAGIKKTDVTDPNYWNGSLLNGGGYNGTANFEVNKDIFDANGKLSNYVNNLMAGNITGGVRPGNVNTSENFFGINYEITGNINSSSQQGKNISYVDPLILDLNNDGVHMSDFGSNPVFFDADNDGSLEQTGWVSAQDGVVVKDLNNNGIIDNISETMSEYFGGVAGTDGGTKPFKDGFAALKSLDSNGDNVFDNKDADWGKVKVWVDANHDGKTDAGELKSFEELNIKQINLANQAQSGEVRDGNEVLARGTYLTTDGKLQEALAANFLANPLGHKFEKSGTGTIIDTQGGNKIAAVKAYVAGDGGETVDVAVKGVNNATGGAGNDTLIGDATSNWLAGGAGSDTFNAGAGDDVLLIDAEDKQENIHGGAGMDTVIAIGDKGITLNMSAAEVEIFQGNRGDDVIVGGGSSSVFIAGGDGNDILIGGAANDAINGENDNDMIDGGAGNDILRGGRGRDTIYGGKGDDYIDGGQDDDALYGGAGNDVLRGAAGDDVIDGGDGTDILELSGNLSEYRILRTATGIWISDTVAGRDGTDFVKNVEKANFKDVSLVDIPSNTSDGLENPLPVKDIIKTDKDGKAFDHTTAHYISQAQLLQNDVDWQNDKLTITEVTDAVGGTVKLTEAGDILFTPDASFNGVMSFKYTVKDAKGNIAAQVISGAGDKATMRAAVYLKTPELPVDPLVTDQWYLNDANILPVWKDYTGKGIRIGQFEPGGSYATTKEIFDYRHYDLKNNVDADWLAGNTAGNIAGEGADGKFSNHATLVAGVMVAENNGQGGVGVAYDAKIGGHFIDAKTIGVDLAKMKNYDVVNNSWGITPSFAGSFLNDGSIVVPYAGAAIEGRGGLGTVIVTSGGNDCEQGGNANYSNATNIRTAIAIGAVNANADLSTLQVGDKPFSNPGANLLVSAPGSNITSTSRMITTDDGSTFGADNAVSQGTSFAAPIISGIVALMLQANPKLGYRDVQEILAVSARKFATNDNNEWHDNSTGNWNGGGMHYSDNYGFGMVDARAAVRLAETWTAQQTFANEVHVFTEAKNVNAAITDGNSITSSVTLANCDMRIEHVEVRVHLTHDRPGDLIIKLVRPDGTESILMNRPGVSAANSNGDTRFNNSDELNFVFTTTHDWGESPAGEWRLVVTDAATGKTGILKDWDITAYGKSGALTNDTYYYTDEYENLAGTPGHNATLNDTDGGNDTINIAALSKGAIVNISTGAATVAGKALTIQNPGTIENIVGGEGSDTLVGNAVNNVLAGGRGNDTLSGEGGNDALFGGKGNNILIGGSENDSFIIERNDNCCDTVADFAIGADKLVLSGFDKAILATMTVSQTGADTRLAFSNGQSILLKNITATSFGTTLANNLNVCVSAEGVTVNDILNSEAYAFGSEKTELISYDGLGQQLRFWGGGNTDIVFGTKKNDVLIGGTGDDIIHGGDGDDVIYLQGDNLMSRYKYTDEHGKERIENAGAYGEAGADRFVLKEGGGLQNAIWDFEIGKNGEVIDVVDLSEIPSATDFSQLSFSKLTCNEMIFTVVSIKTDPLRRSVALRNISQEALNEHHFIYRPGNTPGLTNVTGTDLDDNDTDSNGDRIIEKRLVGDAGGNVLDGKKGADIMEGRTGDDTYYVDNKNDKVIELANGGYDTVRTTISLTKEENGLIMADNVEQLELLGKDNLNATGNELNNRIVGNDGNNIIDGGAGIDTMLGGKGNDTYIIDNGFDRVFEADSEGIDTVQASMSYTLGANFENLTLIGTDAINATGNELNNILTGNDGDNKLDGQIGADTMAGGKGNDIYFVDNAGDKVVENAGEGTDTIISSVDYVLASDVENLVLIGAAKTAYGNGFDNQIIGNELDNRILGGKGDDQLSGGLGKDQYYFSYDGNDTIYEKYDAVQGNDEDAIIFLGNKIDSIVFYRTITGDLIITYKDNYASASNSITVKNHFSNAGAQIEKVQFNDSTFVDKKFIEANCVYVESFTGTSGNDNLTGTAGKDVLIGQDGADIMDGKEGVDVMIGGKGDDVYYVDNVGDSVGEKTDEGYDKVFSSVSYSIGNGLEDLALTGTDDINGTGNFLSNIITGNSGKNIIDGGGGYGADSLFGFAGSDILIGGDGNDHLDGGTGDDEMRGKAGDDTYVVDSINDKIIEVANEGNDLVETLISYSLAANLEGLKLTGLGNINGTGNELDNYINGNSGDNTIDGGMGNDNLYGKEGNDTLIGGAARDWLDGGAGEDKMYGGSGNDYYLVDNTGDLVFENQNEGTDTVFSSVDYTLGNNLENLQISGDARVAIGNELDNILTGNNCGNILVGGAGNDTLIGGDGADEMRGGTGSDTYWADRSDTVIEKAGEGYDIVVASENYTLTANVEELQLTANFNVDGTGNELSNMIYGNYHDNVIDGRDGDDNLRGNEGNDTLIGGKGHDLLVGGADNDTYIFNIGDGQDSVAEYSGTNDLAKFGATDLQLMISRVNENLIISTGGTTDKVEIWYWYQGDGNKIETIEAGNGKRLLSTQIDSLMAAMVQLQAQKGMSWNELISSAPNETQTVLNQFWTEKK